MLAPHHSARQKLLAIEKETHIGKKGIINEFSIPATLNEQRFWMAKPSFLRENTVYMLLTAMCRSFYLIVLEKIAQKVNFVKSGFRLKKFNFMFMTVPYKWVTRRMTKNIEIVRRKDLPPTGPPTPFFLDSFSFHKYMKIAVYLRT